MVNPVNEFLEQTQLLTWYVTFFLFLYLWIQFDHILFCDLCSAPVTGLLFFSGLGIQWCWLFLSAMCAFNLRTCMSAWLFVLIRILIAESSLQLPLIYGYIYQLST